MKIEDGGVTAEFVPGQYPIESDYVRFSTDETAVDVPLHILQLAWHAWV